MKDLRWVINFVMPISLIIYGYIYIKRANKGTNSSFGYRTSRSMKSKETWEYSNNRLGKLWMILGFVLAIFSVAYSLIFQREQLELSKTLLILGLIICIAPLFIVEKELKERFDEEGKVK